MVRLNTKIKLYIIEVIQNKETGKFEKKIVKSRVENVSLQEVGMETYYSAYSNNIKITKVVELRGVSYKNEQFIALFTIDHNYKPIVEVYEVERVAKGKTSQFIKLPLIICSDSEIVKLILNDCKK